MCSWSLVRVVGARHAFQENPISKFFFLSFSPKRPHEYQISSTKECISGGCSDAIV